MKPRSLFWKLAGLFLGVILSAAVLHALTVGRQIRGVVHDVQRALFRREAAHLLRDLPAGLLAPGEGPRLEAWLRERLEGFPNLSVTILEGEDAVLARYRPVTWTSPRGLAAALRAGEVHLRRPPAHLASARVGGRGVEVLVTQARPGHALVLERDPYVWVWGLGILTLATVGAGLLGLRLLTRRLSRLRRGVAAMAAGELSTRVDPGPLDEVGELIASVNAMAARLERSLEELAAQDRARREMLAEVSHELRTPLTTLSGHLEMLAEGPADTAETARVVTLLREEVATLTRRSADLLDLARSEADALTLEQEPVDARDALRAVTRRHEDLARTRGLTLGVTEGEAPLPVLADPARLEQVLENLLQNALGATPQGGAVRIGGRMDAGAVVLEVEDTGPGIPEAEQARIFDRFFRGGERRGGGTGLGLAVADRLVRAHGGALTVESREGEGATFRVRLPRHALAAEPPGRG